MARKSKRSDTSKSLSGEITDVSDELMKGDDRSTALVRSAYLQTALELLLREFMVDDAKAVDKLFGDNWPLGTFSSCIAIAYCTGLIGPKTRKSMDTIRSIRNDFAHTHAKLSFENQSFVDQCRNLYRDVIEPIVGGEMRLSTRHIFALVCCLIAAHVGVKLISSSHRKIASDGVVLQTTVAK
jgi:hypothetical protein